MQFGRMAAHQDAWLVRMITLALATWTLCGVTNYLGRLGFDRVRGMQRSMRARCASVHGRPLPVRRRGTDTLRTTLSRIPAAYTCPVYLSSSSLPPFLLLFRFAHRQHIKGICTVVAAQISRIPLLACRVKHATIACYLPLSTRFDRLHFGQNFIQETKIKVEYGAMLLFHQNYLHQQ